MHRLIKHRKWRWIGYTLRRDPDNIAWQTFDLNRQGKRKHGNKNEKTKPKQVGARLKLAQGRKGWLSVVEGICPS